MIERGQLSFKANPLSCVFISEQWPSWLGLSLESKFSCAIVYLGTLKKSWTPSPLSWFPDTSFIAMENFIPIHLSTASHLLIQGSWLWINQFSDEVKTFLQTKVCFIDELFNSLFTSGGKGFLVAPQHQCGGVTPFVGQVCTNCLKTLNKDLPSDTLM
jgi:hypothetical protein